MAEKLDLHKEVQGESIDDDVLVLFETKRVTFAIDNPYTTEGPTTINKDDILVRFFSDFVCTGVFSPSTPDVPKLNMVTIFNV